MRADDVASEQESEEGDKVGGGVKPERAKNTNVDFPVEPVRVCNCGTHIFEKTPLSANLNAQRTRQGDQPGSSHAS